MKNEKIIGILGGMGPEATASFFKKIINKTEAASDQEHYRVIIDSNPKIPDRTKYILGEGENPSPAMSSTAKNLEQAGADIIAIPCMTAHYFHDEVQKKVDIPIADAYSLLAQYLLEYYPSIIKVGILATNGSRLSRQFEDKLSDFEIVYPSIETQNNNVMEAIYGDKGIKSGYYEKPRELLKKASKELETLGAEVIIAGCTEVELALKQEDIELPLVDPMEVMADFLTK